MRFFFRLSGNVYRALATVLDMVLCLHHYFLLCRSLGIYHDVGVNGCCFILGPETNLGVMEKMTLG